MRLTPKTAVLASAASNRPAEGDLESADGRGTRRKRTIHPRKGKKANSPRRVREEVPFMGRGSGVSLLVRHLDH